MAGGRQPEQQPPQGPFACDYCSEVWPSARALSWHVKAHIKGKAPVEVPAAFPPVPVPPGFGSAPRMMTAAMPRFFLPPPPTPPAMALGRRQAVAPPPGGPLYFDGRRVQVRQVPVPQLRDPVVYSGLSGAIRMSLLEPNHGFWAGYRMGMMDAPVEIDFMGLRPRPDSPSPSFASWLNNA